MTDVLAQMHCIVTLFFIFVIIVLRIFCLSILLLFVFLFGGARGECPAARIFLVILLLLILRISGRHPLLVNLEQVHHDIFLIFRNQAWASAPRLNYPASRERAHVHDAELGVLPPELITLKSDGLCVDSCMLCVAVSSKIWLDS